MVVAEHGEALSGAQVTDGDPELRAVVDAYLRLADGDTALALTAAASDAMAASRLVSRGFARWGEPSANMARFYILSLEETLFGDTALVREWGRLGSSGRRRLDLFEARAQASEALESWLSRKQRRGYELRPRFC